VFDDPTALGGLSAFGDFHAEVEFVHRIGVRGRLVEAVGDATQVGLDGSIAHGLIVAGTADAVNLKRPADILAAVRVADAFKRSMKTGEAVEVEL
jgi:flagellar biosynthesis/type III secretory pathway ATPase